jgi:membrane peptidoglycan carboxypeptidase
MPSRPRSARHRGTIYVSTNATDPAPEEPMPRRDRRAGQRKRRRLRRAGLALGLVLAVLAGVASGGVYGAFDTIPLPAEVRSDQASVLYYADGVTELARVGVENRTDVPLAEIPVDVQRAVLAAEDRGFFGHPGISVIGIGRALVANATSSGTEGASTITQQYVKNAFLSQERTVDRKLREMVLAVKTERKYSKEKILEFYLNTIYFGRGAYGLDAAAHTYFGVAARELSVEQGAVLAAVIKSPSGFDPANNADAAQGRWRYLLTSMVDEGWLSADRAGKARYPQVQPPGRTSSGTSGYVVARVERELAKRGISEQQLRTSGLRIVTTVDKRAQEAAVATMSGGLATQPRSNRGALVAVQPGSGRIRAYYGGKEGYGFFDYADGAYPAGDTFKPFALAEALRQGHRSDEVWDGSSPQNLPGRGGAPLHNRGDVSCPKCTLAESMRLSLNTPFYALAHELGPERVAELAHRMGIRRTAGGRPTLVDLPGELTPGETRADIALGRYHVTPVDQAVAYATFAAGGVHADPYLVERVTRGGAELYRAQSRTARALGGEASIMLTEVLMRGPERSDGRPATFPDEWLATFPDERPAALSDRPAAAKEGTVQYRSTPNSSDAWTVGYTPQLAVSVWLGHERPAPLLDAAGQSIKGEGLPATLWSTFLGRALAGTPPEAFPVAEEVPPPAEAPGRAEIQ